MNTETKRHIDGARQVLVGVVPNPTSQIDQITNALIYKFMDDMDQAAIKAGGDPSFFTGNLEKYAWTRLMDARMGNQERMNLYSEALLKFSESPQLPALFRGIFKSAFLPYRSPEVLGLFLKEIDFFDYSHPEELGNAYEYLLSIMSSQGDAGQFRTPRHIIDFIVDVVNPTKDDKVLDPACGTGGFLVSAYNQILEQHDGKDDFDKKEKPLTPDQRKNLMNNFEGYDVDPGMVRIAQVNMYLHQFKNPKIVQYDTLSMEERWGDKFDVILANPPFMSPKGGVKTHSKFSIESSRSEVLFVDYIMNHLRPKGRAGIIVPEGIIFQSGKSHKELRKNLVNDGLYAVVSLPSGVFAPYSGVKTSILLFNNELAKVSKEILFVKIENDGFDLGAQRRESQKNDLPIALEILNIVRTMIEKGLCDYHDSLNKWIENHVNPLIKKIKIQTVKKSKIAEDGDYNLSGDRYRIATDYSNAKWPMVDLGEIVEILDSKRKPITKSDRKSGQFPYYGATGILDYVDNFIFDERLVLIGEDGAKWDIGDKTAFIAEGKYWVNNHAHVVRPIKDKIIDTFLVSYLNSIDLSPFIMGVTVPKLNQEKLRSIKIPLPPLEIQEQIVAELDGYAGIIAGAKQIAQNWKPKIDIDPEWESAKLGEVVDFVGGYAFKSEELKKEKSNDIDLPVIKIGNVGRNGEVEIKDAQYFPNNKSLEKFIINKDDILIAMTGATVGKVAVSKFDNLLLNQRVGLVRADEQKLSKYFLKSVLLSDEFYEYCQMTAGGGAQGNISPNQIKEYEIPLPPLAIQKQIVEKIEAERVLVEGNKKLVEIYEQKTKDVIGKLWEA
jgi:type I restriction enzyme M protein